MKIDIWILAKNLTIVLLLKFSQTKIANQTVVCIVDRLDKHFQYF